MHFAQRVVPGILLAVLTGVLVAANMPEARLVLGLGAAALAVACLAVGGAALRACGLRDRPELAMVVGLVALSYALALPARFLGLDLRLCAAVFCAIAVTLVALRRPAIGMPLDVPGLLILLAAGAFALAWSLEVTGRIAEFSQTGQMHLWIDAFIHATAIAEFGDPRSIGRGTATLVDMPGGLYHFVSYAIPGLAVRATDVPPLSTIAGVWLPVGVFAMALGTVALGRALAGVAGGALALTLLAALPDSASYGLRLGFLSFHWLLETAPTSAYGLACALASLVLLAEARRGSPLRSLLLSAALFLAVFLLRAHVFVWAALPWAVGAVASAGFLPDRWRWRWRLIAIGSFIAVAGLAFVSRDALAAQGVNFVGVYFAWLGKQETGTPHSTIAIWLLEVLGPWLAIPPAILLAWAGFGLLPLVCTLVGAWLVRRCGKAEMFDLVPLAALFWSAALMLMAPTPLNNDFTEFRQRGFLLVALLLVIWTARWLVILFPGAARPRPLALLACFSGLVTWQFGAEWKAPRMAWGQTNINNVVAPEVVAAAAWLRTQAGLGDAFALASVDDAAMLADEGTILSALSGVPVFLARAGIHRAAGAARAVTVAERAALLRDIRAAPNPQALVRLRDRRIGFYVVTGDVGPDWDRSRTASAYRNGEIAIYRTSPN